MFEISIMTLVKNKLKLMSKAAMIRPVRNFLWSPSSRIVAAAIHRREKNKCDVYEVPHDSPSCVNVQAFCIVGQIQSEAHGVVE